MGLNIDKYSTAESYKAWLLTRWFSPCSPTRVSSKRTVALCLFSHHLPAILIAGRQIHGVLCIAFQPQLLSSQCRPCVDLPAFERLTRPPASPHNEVDYLCCSRGCCTLRCQRHPLFPHGQQPFRAREPL